MQRERPLLIDICFNLYHRMQAICFVYSIRGICLFLQHGVNSRSLYFMLTAKKKNARCRRFTFSSMWLKAPAVQESGIHSWGQVIWQVSQWREPSASLFAQACKISLNFKLCPSVLSEKRVLWWQQWDFYPCTQKRKLLRSFWHMNHSVTFQFGLSPVLI